MKKSITITIPEPCHEDWATMTPTQKGKHCAVCEKEVIEFTNMTDEEIYKTAINSTNLCGRFTKSQLDRPIQLQRKENRSWASYAASLLLPITILATQEIKAQSNTTPTEQTDGNYKSLGISSLSRKQNKSQPQQQSKRIIKGIVNSQEGPVPMAIIYIKGANYSKGTKKFVQTDMHGNYELEVTEGDHIIFSSLGYKELEVKIKKQNIINVTLEDLPVIIVGKLRLKESDKTATKHS